MRRLSTEQAGAYLLAALPSALLSCSHKAGDYLSVSAGLCGTSSFRDGPPGAVENSATELPPELLFDDLLDVVDGRAAAVSASAELLRSRFLNVSLSPAAISTPPPDSGSSAAASRAVPQSRKTNSEFSTLLGLSNSKAVKRTRGHSPESLSRLGGASVPSRGHARRRVEAAALGRPGTVAARNPRAAAAAAVSGRTRRAAYGHDEAPQHLPRRRRVD